MNIFLNGKSFIINEHMTLQSLIQQYGCISGTFAVAVNENFIPSIEYQNIVLKDDDCVEIVTAIQGG